MTVSLLPAAVSTAMSGMMFACWSIVIVLIVMMLVFMRAEKTSYAVATGPLLILPLAYVVSGRVASWLALVFPMTAIDLRIIINVVASLAACLLIGFTAQRIAEKRSRRAFIICCTGFILLLTLALVINLMNTQTLA